MCILCNVPIFSTKKRYFKNRQVSMWASHKPVVTSQRQRANLYSPDYI